MNNRTNPNYLFKEYNDVVTVDDVCQMLHIGRSMAYKLLGDGTIKTIKIGKRFIIPKQSIIDFLGQAS